MVTHRNEADCLTFDKRQTTQLSRNFTSEEWASKCGSDMFKVHPVLIAGVQEIRDACDFPIRITSGYRTEAHNNFVGGASGSLHTKGMAVDLQASDRSESKLQRIISEARKLGFVVRPYPTFVHIDCGVPRIW
jgi:zinc D-Ala-D-Ala carboxypeptidase